MDITGKLGTQDDQQYVIVTVDALTKYVLLHYATDKSPHSTLASLNSTYLELLSKLSRMGEENS